MATHNMNEFMGVRVDPADEPVGGHFRIVDQAVTITGKLNPGGSRYFLDGRLNDSFKAVNLLLDKGVSVSRIDQSGSKLRAGDFIVKTAKISELQDIAEKTGVDFIDLKAETGDGSHEVRRSRLGMYQRYWGGNMDEGWTRFLLEQFAFPYTSLKDAEIKQGNLNVKYDVILLPDDSTAMIMGERRETSRRPLPEYPPEYRSGIGDSGVESLKGFIENGGTLVALGEASLFAIEKFGLKVRNVVENIDSKEFFCPGSTLKVTFDNTHPMAYGMPPEGLVLFWNSPAFSIIPSQHNEDCETVARYLNKDLLRSGWLIGEEHLAGRAAMVSARYGKGRVVLIGFRTQLRSQTHGTFKLLFNTLIQ